MRQNTRDKNGESLEMGAVLPVTAHVSFLPRRCERGGVVRASKAACANNSQNRNERAPSNRAPTMSETSFDLLKHLALDLSIPHDCLPVIPAHLIAYHQHVSL